MASKSKRMVEIKKNVEAGKFYNITDALDVLKKASKIKFDESVEIAVNLGVDSRKSEQAVRGASVLPHGTGKDVKVAVFAQGTNADAAQKAGADKVGYEDLADEIKAGNFDFDVLIATTESMKLVGQLGQVLGPKGLMPNPKVGTVTNDVAQAVKNAKAGQVRYRTDKGGIIHCTIGKVSFSVEQLKDNLNTLLADLKKAKPTSSKGVYLKKITVSSTMGPGIVIDKSSLEV